MYDITADGKIYTKHRNYTEFKVKNEKGTFTIKVPVVEMDMSQVMEELVVPILKAMGYADQSIDKWIVTL